MVLIGKESRAFQTWSIAGFIAAYELLANPERAGLFTFEETIGAMACSTGLPSENSDV